MALPNSLATLKEYCLRQCGAPLVKVNISPDQLDEAVEEAVQYFQEYHNEGQERLYASHVMTQTEIDQGYVVLPENVIAVVSVLNTSLFGGNMSWMTPQYELMRGITFDMVSGAGGVSDYVIARQYLADIQDMLSPAPQFTYRHTTNKLYIFDKLDKLFKPGQIMVYEGYFIIRPSEYSKFWSNRSLRKMAAGLTMMQYGRNLTKYQSIQLPSGITLDGSQIVANGKEMFEEAKEEIDENGFPPGVIMR